MLQSVPKILLAVAYAEPRDSVRLEAVRPNGINQVQSELVSDRLPADIAFCGSEATTASRMDEFTWKQVYASWNQGSRSLQGMALQGETVKQLQLLLALLRLL
jgi:hypothetical protein